jgi:hypothetical protein
MLELVNNTLVFRFPEVHPDAVLTVILHRTLRIPDDGKEYPLPPSLGSFPCVHIDDYKTRVPEKWVGRGGVMIPMYQSEALWFSLNPGHCAERGVQYPFAIKCATGKVSAITGKEWSKKLRADDYMVAPGQPWLDGYVVADGTIKQFVAAPLGLGVTAEGQITGKEEFGGLQLEVITMLREKFESKFPMRPQPSGHRLMRSRGLSSGGHFGGSQGWMGSSGTRGSSLSMKSARPAASSKNYISESSTSYSSLNADMDLCRGVAEISDGDDLIGATMDVKLDMGLAAGGRMRQQVFKDPHGIECWDREHKTRVFIHMANSLGWQHVTGSPPPHPPISAAQYTSHGYPWFDFYSEGTKSHTGTGKTKGLKSLAELQKEKKLPLLPENQSTPIKNEQVKALSPNQVREGSWAK